MKKILISTLVAMILTFPAIAKDEVNSEQKEFLAGFVSGSYSVIGREPDSGKTYSGKVEIFKKNGKMQYIRTTEGEIVKGTASIEITSPPEVEVLRIQFDKNNKNYEGTFLIDSDLDNNGRLSGYVYLKNGKNKIAWLRSLIYKSLRQSVQNSV